MLERGYVPADTGHGGMRPPLRDYQQLAVDRLIANKKYSLNLDLGLGKTRVILEGIRRADCRPVLVIAPLSVARNTWAAEAATWTPELRVSVVVGTAAQRKAALAQDADIYAIGRENTAWLCRHYDVAEQFRWLVVDESSSFKSAASKRFRAIARPAQKMERVTLMSATPTPRDLSDCWSQFYLLDGGERLGRTLKDFRRRYCRRHEVALGVTKWRVRDAAQPAIREAVRDLALHMSASDKLDMPPLSLIERPVELPAAAADALRDVDRGIDPSGAAVENMPRDLQLRLQIANGGYYHTDGGWRRVHDAKLTSLMELMESANEPALILFQFRPEGEMLRAELDRRFGAGSSAVWSGGGGDLLERWDRGDFRALLSHPASIAHGLNLQKSSALGVFYGVGYDLELFKQSIGRLYRQGQSRPVRFFMLVATDLEREIIKVLRRKDANQQALLEHIKDHLPLFRV